MHKKTIRGKRKRTTPIIQTLSIALPDYISHQNDRGPIPTVICFYLVNKAPAPGADVSAYRLLFESADVLVAKRARLGGFFVFGTVHKTTTSLSL